MRGGGGQKMYVFDHAQGIKTVHAVGGWVKKWQNYSEKVLFNIKQGFEGQVAKKFLNGIYC